MALSWHTLQKYIISQSQSTPKYKVGPTGPHKKFQPFYKSMVDHINVLPAPLFFNIHRWRSFPLLTKFER